MTRAMVVQRKTQSSVQLELTEPTRVAVNAWIERAKLTQEQYRFPSRLSVSPHVFTRQYGRIVAPQRLRAAAFRREPECVQSANNGRSGLEESPGRERRLTHQKPAARHCSRPARSSAEAVGRKVTSGACQPCFAVPLPKSRFRPVDRDRERRSPSHLSEPGVQFSYNGL